jgi:type VII secretion integral membrane protein EccD
VACGARVVDLSLPELVPVAALMPQVVAACGLRLDVAEPRPPVLLHPVRGPLPPAASLAEAGVLDGELLVLTSVPVAPPRVVDDLPEAIGAAVAERSGAWTAAVGLLALRSALVTLSVAAAAGLLHGAQRPPALVPVALALGLLGAGLLVRLARVGPATAASLAGAALPWAAAAAVGLAGLPGRFTLAGVAVAAAGVAAGSAAGVAVAPAFVRPALAAALVAAGAGAADAARALGAGLEATAAGVVVAGLALLVLLPRLVTASTRLDDLGEGSQQAEVAARVDAGRRLLAWLLGAADLVVLGAVAALAPSGRAGAGGLALGALAALVLLLRARTWRFTAEVLPMAAAGALGAALVGWEVVARAGGVALAAAAGVAAALAALAGLAAERPGRRPLAGKVVEVIDLVCLVAVVPLALAAAGALGWFAALAAGVVR